jgi:hypothetical protein
MQTMLITAPGEQPLPLHADFGLTLDLEQQRYQLAALALGGSRQPTGAPTALEWSFVSPAADLDLMAQTLAPTAFTARFGDASLLGQIEGAQLIDAPALKGIFKLSEVAPRELMRQFGIEQPVTRDESVLASLAAQGAWSWQEQVARLTDLAVTLDQSKPTGRFRLARALHAIQNGSFAHFVRSQKKAPNVLFGGKTKKW